MAAASTRLVAQKVVIAIESHTALHMRLADQAKDFSWSLHTKSVLTSRTLRNNYVGQAASQFASLEAFGLLIVIILNL